MSMAHQSPARYQRKHVISEHVVQRIRERAVDEVKHHDDRALRDFIDRAIIDALSAGRTETWWQESKRESDAAEELCIVDLKDYVDSTHLYAVAVKGRDRGVYVVRTALTPSQRELKIGSNQWVRDPSQLGRSGLHQPLISPSQVSDLKSAVKPLAHVTRTVALAPDTRVRLVWADEHGEVDELVLVNDAETKEKLGELLSAGIKAQDIEAWTPRPLKIKTRIEYDIEL